MQNPIQYQKWSAIAGIAGVTLIVLCVLVSILGYQGRVNETYSILNHFISELGNPMFTPMAPVFNLGLIGSSILLSISSFGISKMFIGWPKYVVLALGLITGIFCGLVGVFPMDNLWPHLFVAMTFFHFALLLVFFSTAITLFSKKSILPKWTIFPGFLTAIIFAAFILSPSDLVREWIKDPTHFVRPEIWLQCILEWACFFSIIAWILMVAILTLRKAKQLAP